jgi:hypothetical protein
MCHFKIILWDLRLLIKGNTNKYQEDDISCESFRDYNSEKSTKKVFYQAIKFLEIRQLNNKILRLLDIFYPLN